jgi:hypothetical protein
MSALHDQLRITERELYHAMIAGDCSRLRELLADDLVYIHSNGVSESKELYLAGVAAGLYDYEAIDTLRAQDWSHGEAVVRTGLVGMIVGERWRWIPKARIHHHQ